MLFCLLSLVPGNDWREADLVHAREEGEEGEHERCQDELVLVEEGNDIECLQHVSLPLSEYGIRRLGGARMHECTS